MEILFLFCLSTGKSSKWSSDRGILCTFLASRGAWSASVPDPVGNVWQSSTDAPPGSSKQFKWQWFTCSVVWTGAFSIHMALRVHCRPWPTNATFTNQPAVLFGTNTERFLSNWLRPSNPTANSQRLPPKPANCQLCPVWSKPPSDQYSRKPQHFNKSF